MPIEVNTLGKFRTAKTKGTHLYYKTSQTVKDIELKSEIRKEFNLKIDLGQQGKHILGHNNYETTKNKSYLTINNNEIQDIVKQTAGTGEIQYSKERNIFTRRELIVYNRTIGKCLNLDKKWTETNNFMIHYSNKGVHIVPTLRRPKK